jgi:hypothetical protein
MVEPDVLLIVLNDWSSENKAWKIPALRRCGEVIISSLRAAGTDLPTENWDFDNAGEFPVVDWRSTETPPLAPTAVVTFAAEKRGQEFWAVAGRVNRLTGILVLVGTLGTAYFAYLGARSQKDLDSADKQIQQWSDSLRTLQCSNASDVQHTISECINKYADDRRELGDVRNSLSACISK